MKVRTTTARRQLIEQILAPQLHTLYSRRLSKYLKLVAVPGSQRGDYLRQCYAEALVDLLEQNNLLVVRKPDPDTVIAEGAEIDVDIDDADLKPAQAPPVQFRRLRPGDDDAVFNRNDDSPSETHHDAAKPVTGDLAASAPALIADKMPDDDPKTILGRGPGGMRPSDAARENFARLGASRQAYDGIKKVVVPFLRKLQCGLTIVDNADTHADGKATKVTVFVDLPADRAAQ